METKGSTTINNLNDLKNLDKDAKQQSSKASSRSAILDKAVKDLEPTLADLSKARAEATAAADKADDARAKIDEAYDREQLQPVLDARAKVDAEVDEAGKAVASATAAVGRAKDAVTAAKFAYDASVARFDEAQKKLSGLPKTIRDGLAQVTTLQTQVKDALAKQQLVDVGLKGADLEDATADLRHAASAEREIQLWHHLSAELDDRLQKADAQAAAQAELAKAEEALAAAKAKRDDAWKGRLDKIKAAVAAAQTPAAARNEPRGDARTQARTEERAGASAR
ncbi:MAG: hypothetical protein MUC34_01050 [Anaerolineae bacterium]|jgi:DNA repair exonuclease SbcCD ATPase subunit|nr:hypothetical protein [Anaerolineae bacterium]